jgi:hypothetical protein
VIALVVQGLSSIYMMCQIGCLKVRNLRKNLGGREAYHRQTGIKIWPTFNIKNIYWLHKKRKKLLSQGMIRLITPVKNLDMMYQNIAFSLLFFC